VADVQRDIRSRVATALGLDPAVDLAGPRDASPAGRGEPGGTPGDAR
jgi:hypothetical protein